jgi:hypothetical protein
MAGVNPGMIIKVAADIRDALAALGDVAKAEATVTESTEDMNKAYTALDNAVSTFAANAATELFKLAFGAVKDLGDEIWGVVDKVLGLSDAYKNFKEAITDSVRESGVLQRGLETLITSLQDAFGMNREDAVRAIARAINLTAIETLRLLESMLWLGEKGAQLVAALVVPFDAVRFAVNYVWERIEAFEAAVAEMAASVPGVGAAFKGWAADARALADEHSALRDKTYNTMVAHQALVRGEGDYFEISGKVRGAMREATAAMEDQDRVSQAATHSTKELTDANAGLVLGTGEAVVALYNQNKALEDMDAWSRKIKNTDPYAYLKEGMTRTLPPLEATAKAMKDTGEQAIKMSDDVKFAAEVVAKATLSWSEAMDLVRQGQGTMTGQVGQAQRPAGMSDSEWALMQNDPRQWELLHGFDWDAPHAGTGSAWSMGGGGTPVAAGPVQNNSITVNTVAGDKQAIAAVVKDALASDWRSSGVKA